MIKYYLSTLLGLLSLHLFGQVDSFVFPRLDARIVDLWFHAEESMSDCNIYVEALDAEWIHSQETILRINDRTDLIGALVVETDELIPLIRQGCIEDNVAIVSGHTYHIQWQFRLLRHFFDVDDYPLDNLWTMYDVYQELHHIVHDEMFGLVSWLEFMQQVDTMEELWADYEERIGKEVEKGVYYDNGGIHSGAMDKVKECLEHFLVALESEYQDDFEFPCDQLGSALRKMLQVEARRGAALSAP